MYIDKDTKTMKWRDLVGPEKLKLFNKIDILTRFPGIPNATLLQKLWKNFLSIYKILCLKSISNNQIQETVQDWLRTFLLVDQKSM